MTLEIALLTSIVLSIWAIKNPLRREIPVKEGNKVIYYIHI